MNSLMRLLLEVPQLEELLSGWSQDESKRSRQEGMDPKLVGSTDAEASASLHVYDADGMPLQVGAQFAQLAKELRSQFAVAVRLSAERMLAVIGGAFRVSVAEVLKRASNYPQGCSQSEMHDLMQPLLDAFHHTLESIRAPLEHRVFVSVVRGLWDNVSEDLYLYVLELKENEHHQGAWRSRQDCTHITDILDAFFKDKLADYLPHTLAAPDLELPTHSAKVKEMLAQNTLSINRNFSVY